MEGGEFVPFDTKIAWRKIENCIEMSQQVLSEVVGPKGKAFHVFNSRGQLARLQRELVNLLWPLQDSTLKW